MQHPHWDDEMKFELFRFRSELKTENIRVLAEPMGLGLVKRESLPGRSLYPQLAQKPLDYEAQAARNLRAKAAAPLVPAPAYPSPGEMPAAAAQASPISTIPKTLAPAASVPAAAKTGSSRWLWLWLGYCVDIGFVGLCLAMGFIVLGFVIDPANMSLNPHILARSTPMQALREVSAWVLLAGVCGVFCCYWLFFKFVSGATLGETCLHNFHHGDEPSRPA